MSWHKEYAMALTRINKNKEASRVWKKYLQHDSKNADDWFMYGKSLEKANKIDEAYKAYNKAISYDKDKNAKKFGIGIF